MCKLGSSRRHSPSRYTDLTYPIFPKAYHKAFLVLVGRLEAATALGDTSVVMESESEHQGRRLAGL